MSLGLSLCGALVLVFAGKTLPQLQAELFRGGELFGDVLVFLSVFLGAVYTILNKPLATRIGSLSSTAWSCLTGGILLLPLAIVEFQQGNVIQWQASVVLAFLFVTIVCTAVGYALWNRCLTEIPAGKLGLTLFVQPLAGIVVGILWLGETLQWSNGVGGLFILAGVWLIPRGH
jgi:drug/metabolite transporter (DMT)-like permease